MRFGGLFWVPCPHPDQILWEKPPCVMILLAQQWRGGENRLPCACGVCSCEPAVEGSRGKVGRAPSKRAFPGWPGGWGWWCQHFRHRADTCAGSQLPGDCPFLLPRPGPPTLKYNGCFSVQSRASDKWSLVKASQAASVALARGQEDLPARRPLVLLRLQLVCSVVCLQSAGCSEGRTWRLQVRGAHRSGIYTTHSLG